MDVGDKVPIILITTLHAQKTKIIPSYYYESPKAGKKDIENDVHIKQTS